MTIYDIAAELHVSPATVSLALNGNSRVAEKTRLRVIEFAKCKGFTRNEQARNFRLRRTRNVAIVVHNSSFPVFLNCSRESREVPEFIVPTLIEKNTNFFG